MNVISSCRRNKFRFVVSMMPCKYANKSFFFNIGFNQSARFLVEKRCEQDSNNTIAALAFLMPRYFERRIASVRVCGFHLLLLVAVGDKSINTYCFRLRPYNLINWLNLLLISRLNRYLSRASANCQLQAGQVIRAFVPQTLTKSCIGTQSPCLRRLARMARTKIPMNFV